MMRELVQSRWIVGLLVGFYILASQAALPVPTLVFSKLAPLAGDGACVAACSCVSCSPETCCCALAAPDSDSDEGAVSAFAFSCQPDLQWYLAGLPPMMFGARVQAVDAALPRAEPALASLLAPSDVAIGVPTPPPKPVA